MSTGGFVMVPDWLRRRKPSGSAVLVYITLASFGTWSPGTGEYADCRPSVPTLAEETDLSENTVRKSLRELLDLGALRAGGVRRDERGGQLPTVYRVVFGLVVGPPPQNLKGAPSESEGEGVQKDTPGGVPKSEGNQEPSTKNQDTKKPSASPRGTRLPKDWVPSQELKLWFLGEFGTGGDWSPGLAEKARTELAQFADYWAAQPGQRGVKLDWDATWRRWMRTAMQGWRPGAAPAAAGQFKTAAEKNAEAASVRMVAAHLADALMEADATLSAQDALATATAEVRRRIEAGERVSVDSCTVPGYIEDGKIQTAREVTA